MHYSIQSAAKFDVAKFVPKRKTGNLCKGGVVAWFPRQVYTVEPPNKGHFGDNLFVPCREVVPISGVCLFLSNFQVYKRFYKVYIIRHKMTNEIFMKLSS